jgi:integrase
MGRKRLAVNRQFPANLYRNPNGYFYYRNPLNGERRGIGQDKIKAFTEARAANAALAAMDKSTLADWVTGKIGHTVEQWVPLYKELWIEATKPAASTLRQAGVYLNRILACEFAWMRLKEVGVHHIAKLVEETEKRVGSSTALMLRARLHDMFRMAETRGFIDAGTNPVTATYTPSRKVARERLTLEQFHLIYAQAPDWVQCAMNLALLTAQRRDDITSMKFADYKKGFLYVEQGKGQGRVKLQLDGKVGLDKVKMTIEDAVNGCRNRVLSQYMVHHSRRVGMATPGSKANSNALSTAFTLALTKAKITAEEGRTPPTFHEIRSLSERLYREQYGAEFAQAILGHANASMTDKYDDMRGKGYKLISIK